MKLRYQVNTLKQGNKLAKLGVKAESYFVWAHFPYDDDKRKWNLFEREESVADIKRGLIDCFYPAYSCAELGVLLGEYNCQSLGDILEAKLRADKLIYLLEQELIKPEELKL